MTTVGIICAIILGLTGVLCMVRIVRGPTMLDRTVAADVFVAACVGAIGVEAAVNNHTNTLPVLVALALVAFLGSVSIARYAAPDSDRSAAKRPDTPEQTQREDEIR
ncbi:cation:proton antiporter [Aeromicrobium sp. YIM 150415]|uniref:monovalent cation/H+ antiporter complex subunit F n=1 Tax=Aeromicrobium sp. YIM 150415 TaxID=2803912 RepID=UPI0019633C09|nr:monovalent cation/H+ antiporter complex subunit F [Aeromicrobium sp. YIM 150415]MBM9464748.1 cation:proton antiporter [Aeromicrobium sp. YIM 150415]